MEDKQKILDYSELDEADLVAYAKLGSEMAFSELYIQNLRKVVDYISYWIKYTDSEDIAQEAFIRAHHHILEFRGNSKFSTWVKGIARQIINQNHRKTPKFVPFDENMLFAQESEDVLQSLQKQKILSLLEPFAKTLPETQREAFELRIQKGLPYEEISQKTGKKIETLWKACQRVRKKWRRYYQAALRKETKLQKNSR